MFDTNNTCAVCKFVLDTLQGVAIKNDCLVVWSSCMKLWDDSGAGERTEIELKVVDW